MVMHHTPEEHEADPPDAWRIVKVAERCWHLDSSLPRGGTLEYSKTRREAEAARAPGSWLVKLYEQEGRWMAGETPPGHRPYTEVVAERRRLHDRWHEARPLPDRCQFCAAQTASAAVAAGG